MLSTPEIVCVFNILMGVWGVVNSKFNISPQSQEAFDQRNPKLTSALSVLPVRNKFWETPHVFINEYLESYGDELSESDRQIVLDWRDRHILGKFAVLKFGQDYDALLMRVDENFDQDLYAVHGLASSIGELLPPFFVLPTPVEAVLLPLKGKIIVDGFLITIRRDLPPWVARTLKLESRKIKRIRGVNKSL
jgi:hypothetical protein